MNKSLASWKLLLFAAALPILVIMALNLSLGEGIHKESFKRFANSILTSYIVVGLILLGNLFFYADSRHRPLAPLVGMLVAIGLEYWLSGASLRMMTYYWKQTVD